MRIIAGRDYYDSGMGLGHDDSIVFVRSRDRTWTNREAQDAGFRPPSLNLEFHRLEDTRVRDVTIIHGGYQVGQVHHRVYPVMAYVCGKLYRGIASEVSYRGYSDSLFSHGNGLFSHRPARQVYWDWASFRDAMAALGLEPRTAWRLRTAGRATVQSHFDRRDADRNELDRLIADRITVLTYIPGYNDHADGRPWQINGDNLKDIEFFRVMDAYTMFQEISMWLGGVLAGSGNPMVEIRDDRIKLHKHGFDAMSFRKAKETLKAG